ncbi:MAG: nicotinate-nucleotide adenylyltransferase [Acidimicrobiia bacterium]
MRTGILGGTFDPVHIAHLHAGETALHQAGLDRVVFIPAGDPWQKASRGVTEAAHRLEMVRLAAEGVPGFEVDDREVAREGPTYTADTLASFPVDEDLFLILGADSVLGIETWHRYDEVLDRVTVLVAPRPGYDPDEVLALIPDAVILEMAPLGVRGTEIRAMAREGRPFRFLVTDTVYRYILEQNLYTDAPKGDSVGVPEKPEEQS